MISRGTLFVDRLATLLLGAALIAGAALGWWWWSGDSPLPSTTETAALTDLLNQPWWPWASAAVGVALILVGLRWIAEHLRTARVRQLELTGSGPMGGLSVGVGHVASAAAQAFKDTLGVRDAKGFVRRERGALVATVTAAIEPDADLAVIVQHADRVSAELAQVLGRDDVRCRINLRVAGQRSLSRIR